MDSIGRYNSRCFEQQNHYVYTNLSFEKTSVEIDSVLVDWIHQYVRLKDLRFKEKKQEGANVVARVKIQVSLRSSGSGMLSEKPKTS